MMCKESSVDTTSSTTSMELMGNCLGCKHLCIWKKIAFLNILEKKMNTDSPGKVVEFIIEKMCEYPHKNCKDNIIATVCRIAKKAEINPTIYTRAIGIMPNYITNYKIKKPNQTN